MLKNGLKLFITSGCKDIAVFKLYHASSSNISWRSEQMALIETSSTKGNRPLLTNA